MASPYCSNRHLRRIKNRRGKAPRLKTLKINKIEPADILIQINIGKPRPHFVEIETMIALGQGTFD
jgi:hypothetical protein